MADGCIPLPDGRACSGLRKDRQAQADIGHSSSCPVASCLALQVSKRGTARWRGNTTPNSSGRGCGRILLSLAFPDCQERTSPMADA